MPLYFLEYVRPCLNKELTAGSRLAEGEKQKFNVILREKKSQSMSVLSTKHDSVIVGTTFIDQYFVVPVMQCVRVTSVELSDL